jgi:hypothetical protein
MISPSYLISPYGCVRILNEQSALKSAEANSRSKMIQEFIFNILMQGLLYMLYVPARIPIDLTKLFLWYA